MSLEEIGALLGFVAFVGLAVLIFLTFQQARHIRRLRDWAGRAPERAAAAAAGVAPGGEDSEEFEEIEPEPSRLDEARERWSERWAELDRRMPVSPKIVLGGLGAAILGLGIATSGFGLVGGDDPATEQVSGNGSSKKSKQAPVEKQKPVRVAVFNGTAPSTGGTGIVGIADRVSKEVRQSGFRIGTVGTVGSYPATVVMFAGNNSDKAQEVADGLEGVLGETPVEPITPDVQALLENGDVALVIGLDDTGL